MGEKRHSRTALDPTTRCVVSYWIGIVVVVATVRTLITTLKYLGTSSPSSLRTSLPSGAPPIPVFLSPTLFVLQVPQALHPPPQAVRGSHGPHVHRLPWALRAGIFFWRPCTIFSVHDFRARSVIVPEFQTKSIKRHKCHSLTIVFRMCERQSVSIYLKTAFQHTFSYHPFPSRYSWGHMSRFHTLVFVKTCVM